MFACTKSEFGIFATKLVQKAIFETREMYRPITPVGQRNLDFVIPGDNETYIDSNIHLYVRGKLLKADGTEFYETDNSSFVNNFLHSLFSQCNATLNGV
jgi:hypothetical protein